MALIVGVVACIATLVVVFGYAILSEPERLVASMALPELIYAYSDTPWRYSANRAAPADRDAFAHEHAHSDADQYANGNGRADPHTAS